MGKCVGADFLFSNSQPNSLKNQLFPLTKRKGFNIFSRVTVGAGIAYLRLFADIRGNSTRELPKSNRLLAISQTALVGGAN